MSALNPPLLHRLDHACKPIVEVFGPTVYLVGSVQENKANARSDIDVRLILTDKDYDRLMRKRPEGFATLIDFALGAYVREMSGLQNIDFQVQRMTEANNLHGGKQRNPLGVRPLTRWIGDARPGGDPS